MWIINSAVANETSLHKLTQELQQFFIIYLLFLLVFQISAENSSGLAASHLISRFLDNTSVYVSESTLLIKPTTKLLPLSATVRWAEYKDKLKKMMMQA